MDIRRLIPGIATCALVVALAGCSYPTRNEKADVINETFGYRLGNLAAGGAEDTLVVVTASGGGTRATALALSTLRALDKVRLPTGRSLAQEIDVISSVSGGSVAAAYFALAGRGGFDTLEHDFVRRNGMAAIMSAGLNPFGLAKLSTPGTERIDLLIDYLDRQLFKKATYRTLLEAGHRPLLVVNAADMVEGIPFSFTQRKLNLLCSELTKIPLATAVAASAAFPVALSPVTLTNYQPCEATPRSWPPAWVEVNLDDPSSAFASPSLWYDAPQRTLLARAENAYAMGRNAPPGRRKSYVHLLDGGIADNLGLFEPHRMLTTADTDPSLWALVNSGTAKKLIFVVINARSFAASSLDESQATPGMLDMLMSSINAPIDRATAGTALQLRETLLETFQKLDRGLGRFAALARNTALVTIDFDAIADDACRRKFQSIPTSWHIKKEQVDALLEVGGALLANDPSFAKLLSLAGAARPDLPTLADTCGKLAF
ncbi:MAG: patatin-like phospholipase family protein [Rhodospirillaceae bacterium]|nr:patatin-like phospholipase family protein [Rhodospirillaceae bacterium]